MFLDVSPMPTVMRARRTGQSAVLPVIIDVIPTTMVATPRAALPSARVLSSSPAYRYRTPRRARGSVRFAIDAVDVLEAGNTSPAQQQLHPERMNVDRP